MLRQVLPQVWAQGPGNKNYTKKSGGGVGTGGK